MPHPFKEGVYFRHVNTEDFFELGYISRVHGVKGAFIIQMDTDHPEHYRQLKEVWIKNGNSVQCFDTEEISIRNREAIVKLKTVNSVDEAATFIKKTVLLPLQILPQLTGKDFYFHEIRGFILKDDHYGAVGKIETVYDMPQHPVAGILVNGNEILIPLVPEFIENIDRKNKIIFTQLPEGMIEVYTQKSKEEDN